MARLEVIRPPKLAQLFFIFLLGVILEFYLSDSHDSIPF